MRFIDFFAGIGGFRLGMEMAGHECVGHCEIDNFADKSYRAMHMPKESEWFAKDIRTVEYGDLPKAECYCFGFPCQSFSVAGSRGGFADTRGTLFFEVMRIAKERKPEYLFAENVAGLLSHDGGRTFGTILATLGELGYWWEYQVLNSKNFGVPQNRERVFIIGHLGGRGGREIFPLGGECQSVDRLQGQHVGTITTRTGVNGTVGTYIVEGEQFSQDINQIGNLMDTESFGGNPQVGRVCGIDGISPYLNTMGGGGLAPKIAVPVLTPDRAEKRQNGRRFKENGEPMFTLTAQDRHGIAISDQRYIDGISDKYSFAKKKAQEMFDAKGFLPEMFNPYNSQEVDEVSPTVTACCDRSTNSSTVLIKQNNFRIRKLTPKECFRLQGFPDEYFERAKAAGVSDSQLYKQAGNSVTVNVIHEIAKRLKESGG